MKKSVISLLLVVSLACSVAVRADADMELLTVRLPDYTRESYRVDRMADYGLLPVEDQEGRFRGYVDTAGRLALSVEMDDGRLFHGGLAAVRRGGKFGYIDKTGAVVVPLRYDGAEDFSQGLATVAMAQGGGYRWAVIDQTGRELVSKPYINPYAQGMAWFQEETGKYGFLNSAGEVAIDAEYDMVADFSEGLAWVGKLGEDGSYRYGFIDLTGELVVPMVYDYNACQVYFSQGLAQVTQRQGERMLAGYIDRTGQVVIPLAYTPATSEPDGRAAGYSGGVTLIQDGGEYSLWDTQGRRVRTLDVTQAAMGEDGWVAVVQNGRAGAARSDGNDIPAEYSYCGAFCGDLAVVERDGLLGVVDKFHRETVPCKYGDVVLLPGGLVLVDTTEGAQAGRFYLYGSAMMPLEPAPIAYANTGSVEVDGKPVTFQMYALRNSDGYETNYVRVRDVAYALRNSDAHFEVIWAYNAVWLYEGWVYTPQGTEMNALPFSGDMPYQIAVSDMRLNGQETNMAAILLTDGSGGGHTYVKLRDLGERLGFNVGWSAQRGVYIETDKAYEG